MIRRSRSLIGYSLIFLLIILYMIPIVYNNTTPLSNDYLANKYPSSSAQRTVTNQWIKNPTFESPIEPTWYWENGSEGDNSDMDATTSTGQANYDVLGETRTFTLVSGIINSPTSPGWQTLNNPGRTLPDTALITSEGCYASHFWNDDANQFPSVHWRSNLSVGIDMSDYVIVSASLEIIVNATVQSDIDTPNDSGSWEYFAIGDSVTFYSQISDLSYNPPLYTVASNKTKYLGQDSPSILTLADSPLETVEENDLIAALNSAFDKDPDHSNLTLTLGIDIYSEDNLGSNDPDHFDDLYIKTCNLTFTVKKKIDQSTSISWNQVGNTLNSSTVTVTDAKFFFKYKTNTTWPSIAPLSEIRFIINNKTFEEGIIKLTAATTSFQDAKVGGFDVTNLISTDVNISTSIEVFLKDTFELGYGIQISIDEVYLNITYIETFPDYGTDLELFLNEQDKTIDPVIQIPINDMLNITITYKDNVSGNHISTTDAQLEGKVSGTLTENPTLEQYSIEVNTTDLGLGISVLTVSIQKTNYESQSIQIFVEVILRETKLELKIDDNPTENNESISTKFNELLNITVFYSDNLTFTHISGASVNLLGFGVLNETNSQFNFTLDTNDLSSGVNILTIFAQKSNYQSQTIQFYVNVEERSTGLLLYIDGNPKFESDSIVSQLDESLNFTINYFDDLTTSHITSASVSLLGHGNFTEGLNQYTFFLNTNDLSQGVNVLTIYAQKENYQSQTIHILVNILVRTTYLELYIEGGLKNESDSYNTYFNEELNITVLYRDNSTYNHLSGAIITLIGFGDFDEIGSQYNFTLNTNNLENGINILTVFAQLNGYQEQNFQIFINVSERPTELLLFADNTQRIDGETITSQFDEFLNITIIYRDDATKQYINVASISLLGFGNLTEDLNQYTIILDTNDLSEGVNVLTFYAQKDNYQSKSFQIFVDIQERETYLELYIESIEQNDGDTYNTQFGEHLNFTVLYRDNSSDSHLTNANVNMLGFGDFNEIESQYNFTINTDNLDNGINILTIFAQLDGYLEQNFQIFINVSERVSELLLYVDNIQKFDGNTIVSQYDEFLNITVFYRDDITKQHINIASISVLGFENLTENLNQYTLLFDTNNLSQGINVLTILAFKENFESKTIQIFVDIQERVTYLNLFIEGVERNDGYTYNTQFDETINVTIFYRDNLTDNHLTGANVDMLGIGNFTEIGFQFNYSISTNNLEKGINIITIFAQMNGYKPQVIQFFINVNDRDAYYFLFINGMPINQSDTVEFEANELINITVYYEDYITKTHLSGANVELLGIGVLNETFDHYYITINSNNLTEGTNVLTVFAQLTNYQPKSIQFFIEVVERASQLQLFLNGIDMTSDPVLDLPIRTMLNITIKYFDNQTALEISGALVQLIGESLYQNLTENLLLNQYTFIINTSSLLTGVKLFTIVAQAPDYQINIIDLRINVNRIKTSIGTVTGETFVNLDPLDDYHVQIVYNDTDFGETIKNATLTYRWENGQGELVDSDNDGIYEIVLNNIPARTNPYIISITAFAGDDFEFQTMEIVLNVVAPSGPDITLLIVGSASGLAGLTIFLVLYLKVLKYPPKVRKMRKLKKKIGKNKKLKPLTIQSRDEILQNKIFRNKELFKKDHTELDKFENKKEDITPE